MTRLSRGGTFAASNSRQRAGSAVVELAITLPVIVAIAVGSIEMCQLIYVQQTLHVAAHECARIAAARTANDADVTARGQSVLVQREIVSGSISTTPTSIEGLPRGTRITVRVQAPVAGNTWIPAGYYTAPDIEATCVVVKEI